MKTQTKIYFAYGMNTEKSGMAIRCPNAKPLGFALLKDYELTMRGCADIDSVKGSEVYGALWEITQDCEKALDRLESFPSYYGKIEVPVLHKGETVIAMSYIMQPENKKHQSPAYTSYFHTLMTGYAQFEMPQQQIHTANSKAETWRAADNLLEANF